MLEFIPRLCEHSRARYPVGVTLMRGISDLLAALYGGERFVLQMIEEPREVHDTVERLTDYWIRFGEVPPCQHPPFHGEPVFFYSLWTPGATIWLQEDAAALLSPDLYREFILPADELIGSSFDTTVVHLHPSRFLPVNDLLGTRASVIEIHIDKGGPGQPICTTCTGRCSIADPSSSLAMRP